MFIQSVQQERDRHYSEKINQTIFYQIFYWST